jgi:hypothetical protein
MPAKLTKPLPARRPGGTEDLPMRLWLASADPDPCFIQVHHGTADEMKRETSS